MQNKHLKCYISRDYEMGIISRDQQVVHKLIHSFHGPINF